MTLPDLGTPAAFRKHINWDDDDLNVRTHEGVQMELKAGPKENHPEKLVHTIAAVANTLGGTIIVGVGEGGKKTGLTYADGLVPVKNGDKLRRDVTHLLGPRLTIDPLPAPSRTRQLRASPRAPRPTIATSAHLTVDRPIAPRPAVARRGSRFRESAELHRLWRPFSSYARARGNNFGSLRSRSRAKITPWEPVDRSERPTLA